MPARNLELTLAEKLRVARRREQLTQAEMAAMLELPLHKYKAAEAGQEPVWADDEHHYIIPAPKVGQLAVHELMYLLRRRKGWTLAELSREVGLSRNWLCDVERGKVAAPAKLLAFWDAI